MTQLFIDRQAFAFNQSVQTWADLLTQLDRDMDARGRLLTEVQFDGVDDPTFRDTGALRRALSGVVRIDAATATPHDLLRDCLLEAAGTVAALRDESTLVAERFRTVDPGDAHARLGHLAGELAQLVVLVHTLQGPLAVDLARRDDGAPAADTDLARFAGVVDALVAAQGGGDHHTVADILEYDLMPFLGAWQTRFERLAG